MSVTKSQIIVLYRNMLREAKKFPAYNFRNYALRRIRVVFNENRKVSDKLEIQKKYDYGLKNLEILKRQVVVTSLYKVENIVVENTAWEERSSPARLKL